MFADARGRSGRHRARRALSGRRPRRPKFPPSPRASAPKRRPSPTARSSTDSSRPPSAPNIIWPAGSTASGNTTCRCGCSPTATAPTARRNWPRSSPTSAQRVQHLDIAMAESSDGANVAGQAGARPRSLSHHHDLLRQRTGARDHDLARSAMPVRLSQEREIRDRAFRRDPHRRQRRFHLPRLRL